MVGQVKAALNSVGSLGQLAREYIPGVSKLDSLVAPVQLDTAGKERMAGRRKAERTAAELAPLVSARQAGRQAAAEREACWAQPSTPRLTLPGRPTSR